MDKQINFAEPLKLMPNRVNRSYLGGKLIDSWKGLRNSKDNHQPEEWIASVVKARNSVPINDEGLSKVEINNEEYILKDLVSKYPGFYLGDEHFEKFGADMAVLTKVLDAAVRLSIQVHPTKTYAREHFQSEYGKTEAWYILGEREGDEAPYVLAGFKEGVTKEQWKTYFEEQDIEAMINALHKFEVKKGDVVLIEGGLPHAIGSGCFLIEIQEPTDFTMRIERKTFDGAMLPDMLCHQGVGFEKMLECFNYDCLNKEQTKNKYFIKPEVIFEDHAKNTIISLISLKNTTCFSMKKLVVNTSIIIDDESFKSCLVVLGNGILKTNGKEIKIKQGSSYFLPAALGSVFFEKSSLTEDSLEIILCYPPKT